VACRSKRGCRSQLSLQCSCLCFKYRAKIACVYQYRARAHSRHSSHTPFLRHSSADSHSSVPDLWARSSEHCCEVQGLSDVMWAGKPVHQPPSKRATLPSKRATHRLQLPAWVRCRCPRTRQAPSTAAWASKCRLVFLGTPEVACTHEGPMYPHQRMWIRVHSENTLHPSTPVHCLNNSDIFYHAWRAVRLVRGRWPLWF
jgi:hypothetical protein